MTPPWPPLPTPPASPSPKASKHKKGRSLVRDRPFCLPCGGRTEAQCAPLQSSSALICRGGHCPPRLLFRKKAERCFHRSAFCFAVTLPLGALPCHARVGHADVPASRLRGQNAAHVVLTSSVFLTPAIRRVSVTSLFVLSPARAAPLPGAPIGPSPVFGLSPLHPGLRAYARASLIPALR